MPAILLFRSLIKFTSNAIKALLRIVYFIYPGIRVSIPSERNSIVIRSPASEIPRVIWQTNFTQRVTLPVYLNYLFNRIMAPSYGYRFMVTHEREVFVREHYPKRIYEAYLRLQIGAAQADFWRVLILHKFGGVYMDIDAHLIWPLEMILNTEQEELFLQIKTGEISNYFVASKPGNPNLEAIINQIVQNIELESSDDVYGLTGPGVFNKVLGDRSVLKRYYLYTCNQGNFTNEYFQYIDKPQGKWTKEQQKVPILKPKADVTH